MADDWKQWEGRTIHGKFPVQRLLGGSDRHAVFLVERSAGEPGRTVLRVLDVNSPFAHELFQHWQAASRLKHPNLLQMFETGRCNVDGRDFFYVRTEYGEEDLSQILPARALTVPETQQILQTVLPALSYLHGQGLIHGSLKPSNIFAVGEAVKLSTDSVRPPGKADISQSRTTSYEGPEAEQGLGPAGDVWSLGITLTEALTQRLPVIDKNSQGHPVLPDGIPHTFRGIIENCLQVDPAKRPTATQIADHLNAASDVSVGTNVGPSSASRQPPAEKSTAPGPKRPTWVYIIAVALAVLVAALLIARQKRAVPSSEPQPGQAEPENASPPPKAGANARDQAENKPKTPPLASPQSPHDNGNSDAMSIVDSRDDVLQRVAPAVSPSARRTITGKIRLRVLLNVDENGNVREARLQSAGPSKYFARVTLDAARQWKFKPAVVNGQAVPSKWNLRFAFTRRGTEAAAERTAP